MLETEEQCIFIEDGKTYKQSSHWSKLAALVHNKKQHKDIMFSLA